MSSVASPSSSNQQSVIISWFQEEKGRSILSKITINCHEEKLSFIFEADCDLINDIFRGLEDLYWKNPMKVSAAHVIGVLLSNMSDVYHYCGHTLSTESLAEVVSEALTSTAIEAFATLACFVVPDMRCFKCDARGRRVPMQAGPLKIITTSKESDELMSRHHESTERSLTSLVSDFEKKLKAYRIAADQAVAPDLFSYVVKQWTLIKHSYNIQSVNNLCAQKIDARLLAQYEDLIVEDKKRMESASPSGTQESDRELINLVLNCVRRQPAFTSANKAIFIKTAPVFSDIPTQLKQTLSNQLWPLLVLSEAFGVKRLFSALSYLMLQRLRMHSIEKVNQYDTPSSQKELLNQLELHEEELDNSLSTDRTYADHPIVSCGGPDLSMDQGRREDVPMPVGYPIIPRITPLTATKFNSENTDRKIISPEMSKIVRNMKSMFDDDEEANRQSGNKSISRSPVSVRPEEAIIIPSAVKEIGVGKHKPSSPALIASTISDAGNNNRQQHSEPGNQGWRIAAKRVKEYMNKTRLQGDSNSESMKVKERLALVQCEAAIARARSASPKGKGLISRSMELNSQGKAFFSISTTSTDSKMTTPQSKKLVFKGDTPRNQSGAFSPTTPKTPNTVVDIDETVVRATLKAKNRIVEHRRDLEMKLLQEQREMVEKEEEKWRERDRRIALFVVRQQGSDGSSAMAHNIDKDHRHSSTHGQQIGNSDITPSPTHGVRFMLPDSTGTRVHYKTNTTNTELNGDGLNKKHKKYRRFTKLLYGTASDDNYQELASDSQTRILGKDNLLFQSNTINSVVNNLSMDPISLAEDVENKIALALSPSGPDITGYVKARYESGLNLVPSNGSNGKRNGVFSPDATYRFSSNAKEGESAANFETEFTGDTFSELCLALVKVYRASKLPEMLSGCNPYVFIDWGFIGQAATTPIINNTDPVYRETLRFGGDDSEIVEKTDLLYRRNGCFPAINVHVFHKNISISDEFVGKGHISEVNISAGVHTVDLFDADGENAGQVIMEITLFPTSTEVLF